MFSLSIAAPWAYFSNYFLYFMFQVDFIKQLKYKDCKKVPKILSPDQLCPFDGAQYKKLYDPLRTKLALKKIKESKSFGIKLWRVKNKDDRKNMGSQSYNTTFFALANSTCPINVQLLGKNKHF